MTDPNGVSTIFTYEADRVTSKAVGGRTWRYAYDYGYLFSIQYPTGMYEVFCHRPTGGSGGLCATGSGAPTSQVQRHFLATDETGTGWSELEELEYWPDGRLKTRTLRTPAEVREQHAAQANEDGLRSLSQDGALNGTGPRSVRLFDVAGRQIGLGAPFDGAQALCGGRDTTTGRPVDPRCAAMSYDLGDRIVSMDEPANPGAQPSSMDRTVRTCFRYDGNGNIAGVMNGCAAYSDCSTCVAAASQQENSYTWDDFGNLVEYQLADTSSINGGRGVADVSYTALGLPSQKQTQGMRFMHTMLSWSYDGLGRETSLSSLSCNPTCTGTPVMLQSWDAASGVPLNCPASLLSNVGGRLATASDPLRTTWFGYDEEGRITAELKVAARVTNCDPLDEGSSWMTTLYSYSPNGDLASIKHPHGRTVFYGYNVGALARRVSSVSVSQLLPSGWSVMSAIANVTWEPFGGLRSYRVVNPFSTASYADVEYVRGAAEDPSSTTCAPATPVTNDLTGRLRSIRVTTGTGSTALWKEYRWQADQIAATTTCYVSSASAPLTETFQYSARKQLSAATGSRSTAGGAYASRGYVYDTRGNRTQVVSEARTLTTHWGAGAQVDQLLDQTSTTIGSLESRGYDWGTDGQLMSMYSPVDSSGSPGRTLRFGWGESGGRNGQGIQFGLESVFKAVRFDSSGGSTYWNYVYDGRRQRLSKRDPTGNETRYFWGAEHRLLEDVGFRQSDGTSVVRPIDDYVWLDGRPVVAIRGKVDPASVVRQVDNQGSCPRLGEASSCATNFIVTDLVGRPVVTLDTNMKVASVGEYDPFGHVNRAQQVAESAHPYGRFPGGGFSQRWNFRVQPRRYDMTQMARVHFSFVDTETMCPDISESLVLESYLSGTVLTGNMGGWDLGDVWSPWVNVPTGDALSLHFSGNYMNNSPYSCNGVQFDYMGFAMSEFEYRKAEVGAFPYQPLFRGAGQYYDEETDLFENWNRYYDASTGRYLSPEPMLQSPQYLSSMARRGVAVPAYAYALNNPVIHSDPSGLDVYLVNCGGNVGHTDVYADNACYGPESNPNRSIVGGGFYCSGFPATREAQCVFAAPGEWKDSGPAFSTPAAFAGRCSTSDRLQVIQIPLSCEDTAAALDRMRAVAASPPTYSAMVNNCHDVAQEIALGSPFPCMIPENGRARSGPFRSIVHG